MCWRRQPFNLPGLVIITILQILSGVLLYRYRIHHRYWQGGDGIVLFTPPIAAFALDLAIAAAESQNPTGTHYVRGILVAGVCAGMAFFVTILLNVNLYGS